MLSRSEVGLLGDDSRSVAQSHLKPLKTRALTSKSYACGHGRFTTSFCWASAQYRGPYEPANPPQSTVNHFAGTDIHRPRITKWLPRLAAQHSRSAAIHFTKALTKELSLLRSLEHLKAGGGECDEFPRSERRRHLASDGGRLFSDLVARNSRSIGFFRSTNRTAKLGEMVALGNPMKLSRTAAVFWSQNPRSSM